MCDTKAVSKYTVEMYNLHGSGTWTTEFKTNVLIYLGARQDPAKTNFLAGPLNKYHKY